ncbi:uncharacterized protein LOC117645859 isoform X2 [Thrips palmi]|nr:uncharacterized protein LOC117645859 isoform X2 [Thrips palmi]XP_034242263.1 uncharacterized protein LOC117645859 isoform X2 [Thrips palmi]XP_034242264.1 uncharacterized protein LOC117645859 isoform X2 [Thrips palmi]XP_034242265.1 uncharacterized protein LOC117645859 isoform X2 [Thrips palmi]XP_034242266.1 uncharacterized protein LOC117645859 isoform X2 [Thrips palmi]XP_034242267.1 uncharacterized protein LOC117645859 isoform X2 [Thrips palmi]XP_034242268.1 uncharacterized protein LOC11764
MYGMNGRGKGVYTRDTEQPNFAKQPKMSDWCMKCKAAAQEACRRRHQYRVLDMDAAERSAQAKLQDALRKAERQQAHLEALAKARVLTGPVLVAEVAGVDREHQGWEVSGGDIRIALAATKELTGEDKQLLCAALEGVEVDYEVDETESTVAFTSLGRVVSASLKDKLRDCVEGQAARQGDVLLSADGRLEVFFRDMPSRGGHGTKVLGRVEEEDEDGNGLCSLEGSGCDGRDDASVRSGWGDECWAQSWSCFCRGGGTASTTLSKVRFEA